MPKKSGGGRRAWTYSRMSLTSPEANQRNKIIRPSPTSETDQQQQIILLSHIQSTETRITSGTSNNSCRISPHSSSVETKTADSGNFRSTAAEDTSADDFRSTSTPSRPNNFRSSTTQQRLVNELQESPQAVNNSPLHNFHHRSSVAGCTNPPPHPPRRLDLDVKTAPSPEVCRRDLRHYAEVNLRSSNFLSPEAPRDKGGKIYAAFVLGGVGYMLPFTCFVVAVDFYQTRYPGSTIIFDLTLATILAGSFGVLFNNIMVEALSLTSRVTFGYVTSTTLLLLLTTCDLGLSMFTVRDGYWITLGCVAVVAVGCAVQQSSYYGYANMLPRRYTQAVMLGESIAGTLVSTNRIATKLVLEDVRLNTIIFFVISAALVLICWVTFLCTRKSRFVQFHLLSCTRSWGRYSDACALEGDADFGVYEFDVLDDDLDPRPSYGVLSHNGTRRGLGLQSRSEVVVTTAADYPIRSDSVGLRQADDMTSLVNQTSGSSLFSDRLQARWQVVKLIYPYMTSFALVFFVTASLYPGIVSEMSSCRLGTWMPVVLMACFNLTDALGKILMPVKKDLTRRRLVCSAMFRFSLIPLALMCCMPRLRPILSGEVWPVLLTMVLGFSNGYYGCLPLVLAPSRVAPRFRELCGNTMMLAFAFAIVCGAFTSYGLDLLLGPHPATEACSSFAENSSSLISRHIGVPSLPTT
ncbi:hypothetical protein RRG08_040946 [Elysia crispata]|uniref:Equilibrative nucleoside transporter 4 n=1 Tax=Elysia crispata TaxID=231223 RepID=A0AAE1AMU6_9GAST|nr:hypothetical protein RRG08_040946 [Elysia crispata]